MHREEEEEAFLCVWSCRISAEMGFDLDERSCKTDEWVHMYKYNIYNIFIIYIYIT